MIRKEGGYALICDDLGRQTEMSTVTCSHTNTVIHIPPGKKLDDVAGFCRACMGFIRMSEVGKVCDVFERKLQRAEQRYETRRSYGLN